MKHPALARTLGVFLAICSLITAIAAGIGFKNAGSDFREQQRQDELLASRILEAEALRSEIEALQPDYDKAAAAFPGRSNSHRSESDSYRMKLATYTATRAGLVLGRKQLEEAAAALKEAIRMYYIGLERFEKMEALFQPVFEGYQLVRGALDQGAGAVGDAQAMVETRSPDGSPMLQPEKVLELARLEHQTYDQLRDLLTDMRSGMPEDQREAESYLREALAQYNDIAPMLSEFSIEQLAYDATQTVYGLAEAALQEQIAAGMSEEEARAAADAVCESSFGMSFEDLGQWLDQNEPESGGSLNLDEIPPEILDMALGSVPSDRELVDRAIALIDESDRALSEKEEAFRADPHSVSAAELLIAAASQGVDSAQRLFGLIEPSILQAKQMMDDGRTAMNDALCLIGTGQRGIADGNKQLDDTEKDLDDQLSDLKSKRVALEKEGAAVDAMKATVENYEALNNRYRSLRYELLSTESVSDGDENGGLIVSAKAALEKQIPFHAVSYRNRMINCGLMLLAGLLGIFTSISAFDRLPAKPRWLMPALSALTAGAGELLSLALGRGLWYSAIFIVLFALALFPLGLSRKKGAMP